MHHTPTKFPNFLIIGAAKSGTYTLHTHFARHPEVFMCAMKEPHYFSFGADNTFVPHTQTCPIHSCINSLEAYVQLFAQHQGARMAGESSVSYLYMPNTARRIFEFNPKMKLIVSLRNPVDRAYSSFNMAKSYGLEPLATLAEGIQAEHRRIQENRSLLLRYRDLGLYSRQLLRYFDVFPHNQIKVILYEDFVRDPALVVRQLFKFIGVSTDFQPDPGLHSNETKLPDDANRFHHLINGENVVRSAVRRLLPMSVRMRLREFAREKLFKPAQPISDHYRRQLARQFREEVNQLQKILGRDLSTWLE